MIIYFVMRQIFFSSTFVLILGLDLSPVNLAVMATLDLLNIPYRQQSATSQQLIEQPSLIILTFSQPEQVIQQVHHFRKLQWQGIFITLVNTLTEKEHLLNLSLFGEKDSKLAYGEIPGHKVVLSHSLIPDILAIQNSPGLSSGAWRDYLAKSSIHTLIQQLQQTSIDIQQVIATIHGLNILWDTIISHEQARYIRELKQKYPLGTTPTPSEIPQIITNLQTRLAHI